MEHPCRPNSEGADMAGKRAHHGGRRRGGRPKAHKPRTTVTGILHVRRPGVGDVETAEGSFPVARHGIREGMDGDEVQVTLSSTSHAHGGGPTKLAYVQAVLQRAVRTFLGTYAIADPLGVVAPLDARIRRDFFVLPQDECAARLGVSEGDVVVARILEYPTRKSAGIVTIERRVGPSTELDLDVESVVASFGLPSGFPDAVAEEARALVGDVSQELLGDPQRSDARGECCLTIDPADARDFDDAVGATRLAGGGYEVAVHIADVTHFVRWESHLDLEARRRTCSVYLVDRVIPMLPEELSEGLCSLLPQEDRLCVSVWLRLDSRGEVRGARMAKSVIRSKARLDYDTVDELLSGRLAEGELPCDGAWQRPVAEAIRALDEVARLRARVRRARGSIDFDTRESKVILDASGRPTGVRVRRRSAATSLVEEAMLLANEVVAKALAERDLQSAYRVHERPAPEDLRSCVPTLRELGVLRAEEAVALGSGDPAITQAVLDRARGTSAEYLANALLLRAQKRAVYLPHNVGHYALGARAYCHFTSPIRRYPDVVVHRTLKALLAHEVDSSEQREVAVRLPQICRAASELERAADAAARASQKVKMAELYEGHVGESFPGVVVGVERYGLFVMLDGTCAEGLLPARALGEEWFSYDASQMTLTGESSGRVWRLGKRVVVVVTGTKVGRGQIDFALPEGDWGIPASEGRSSG